MGSNYRIAVIGAAGRTGRALVDSLVARGAAVRPLVRREEQKQNFSEIADIRIADLGSVTELTEALCGIDVAHYIPPTFNSREEEFAANLIGAVTAAGVERLVYHSVLHAPTPAMPHHARKSRVELALRESATNWTIVQPAMYVQTPLAFFDAESGELNMGRAVDRPFSPIDIGDLSEAVGNILLEDGHVFATYELAGADHLDCTAMAEIVSRVLGRTIIARSVDPAEQIDRRVAARGFDAVAASEMRAMFDHYADHGLVGNSNVLRMLLKREPTSFEAAARRDLTSARA